MNRPRQVCAVVLGLCWFLAAAHAQFSFTDQNSVSSLSGQFLVTSVEDDTSFFHDPSLAANTNLVRLKTALLAVAAERFKISLWQELGLPANATWSGKIYLRLHPARSLDETVTITSRPFLNRWNYEVDLPDLISKTRYARALSGVLLLELANRTARPGGHSAELPCWLVDGLAQQMLAADGDKVVLSAPLRKNNDLPVSRINQSERGLDALAAARPVLQSLPVLTFDQLSWPTDAQMAGNDGGAYLACAQLFQHELLGLKNGREKMRALLGGLPDYFNWQMAFFRAFGQDFQRPLDVEKWWALQVVDFAARAPGPRWTTDSSLARLDQLMSVPVEFRSGSNALPSHADVSLQDALKNLDPAQQDLVLRTKVRDFALVELRLAPPFGELADGYRVALAGFLGVPQSSPKGTARTAGTPHQGTAMQRKTSLAETLAKLDALDRRRREAETRSAIKLSGNSNPGSP